MAADDVHIKDATIAPVLVQIQPLSMAKEFKLKSKWKFKSMVVCRDDHLVRTAKQASNIISAVCREAP